MLRRTQHALTALSLLIGFSGAALTMAAIAERGSTDGLLATASAPSSAQLAALNDSFMPAFHDPEPAYWDEVQREMTQTFDHATTLTTTEETWQALIY